MNEMASRKNRLITMAWSTLDLYAAVRVLNKVWIKLAFVYNFYMNRRTKKEES